MPTLQSILVPLDGSPPSLAALDHAVALADDYDARIEALHVVPAKHPLVPQARAEAERAIDSACERARQALGDRFTQSRKLGDPVSEIVAHARGHADLIVMGTHGWIGRLHELLGSVAEGVVRNAPCPVLTVRDQSGDYQGFAERRHHRPSVAEQATSEPHDQARDH